MLRFCLVLALVAGCTDDMSDDDPSNSGPVWGVDVGATKLEVGASTYAFASEVAPRPGEPAMPARGATFSTDDATVLTLTSPGEASVMITGAAVGTANVIAHWGSETSMRMIEVVPKP